VPTGDRSGPAARPRAASAVELSRTVDLVVTTNPGGESKTLVAWVARSNVVIVG
jgi:hypothetical protein